LERDAEGATNPSQHLKMSITIAYSDHIPQISIIANAPWTASIPEATWEHITQMSKYKSSFLFFLTSKQKNPDIRVPDIWSPFCVPVIRLYRLLILEESRESLKALLVPVGEFKTGLHELFD
jgi:hypothetical protein